MTESAATKALQAQETGADALFHGEPAMLRAQTIAPRDPDAYSRTFPAVKSIRPLGDAPARKLKVCIATEDIIGPVRNGGIGTTYAHLAYLLAEDGHDVTILYLRGDHCENGTITDWIAHYAAKGVRFQPLDLDWRVESPSPRWLAPMYGMYRFLKGERFDLVHCSEWRGSAMLSLLAKRQGLAFEDTVFCIKASSPYLWNREYGLRPIGYGYELQKMYAERRSIELADLVIGGSADLLRWMLAHGYRLPEGRAFVQPNVMLPVALPESVEARTAFGGQRVPIKEVVFFGRLEYRKGLHLFCEAMDRLIQQGLRPEKVSFLGKWGEKIPMFNHLSIRRYIRRYTDRWPVESRILENYDQKGALTYLLGEGRMAVMPSLIENSSLAVYETTQYRIPFIGTDVGGNAELVKPEHCQHVLCRPHPLALADRLREALSEGAFVADPSFDNAANLDEWRDFHLRMGAVIDEKSGVAEPRVAASTPPADAKVPALSLCLVLQANAPLQEKTLAALRETAPAGIEVVAAHLEGEEGDTASHLDQLRREFEAEGWRFLEDPATDLAEARNLAAQRSCGDYLLFIDADAVLRAEALPVLQALARRGCADVLVPLVETDGEARDVTSNGEVPAVPAGRRPSILLVGDPTAHFFENGWLGQVLLVRRSVFDTLGGFTTDHRVAGSTDEFLSAATLANLAVETVPEILADHYPSAQAQLHLNYDGLAMRSIRPHVAAAPLCHQTLLMYARSQVDRLERRVAKMENSPSWRLTKPLRMGKPVKQKITKIRNRFRMPKKV